MTFPIKGEYKLSQDYGENPQWYAPSKGHPGRDYACKNSTPIISILPDGVCVWSQFYIDEKPVGFGNNVRMIYPTSEKDIYELHIFAHLLKPFIQTGQPVVEGGLLGFSDNTGWSTGPHLHWEVHILKEVPSRPTNKPYKYYLGRWFEHLNPKNGYFGAVNYWEKLEVPDEALPVDLRYGQKRSIARELAWKAVHERYAKKRAWQAQIPYDDRIMKAFVYGFHDAEFVFSVANFAVWANMHKPEYQNKIKSFRKGR